MEEYNHYETNSEQSIACSDGGPVDGAPGDSDGRDFPEVVTWLPKLVFG